MRRRVHGPCFTCTRARPRAQAEGQLRKSSVVDNDTGEERDSEVRTSSGTFFDKGADEVRARRKGGGAAEAVWEWWGRACDVLSGG